MWRQAGFVEMLVSPAKRDQNGMGGLHESSLRSSHIINKRRAALFWSYKPTYVFGPTDRLKLHVFFWSFSGMAYISSLPSCQLRMRTLMPSLNLYPGRGNHRLGGGVNVVHPIYSYHSMKNWMGPYQRTPKEVARAIRFSGLGVRSVGPVGDFLESWLTYPKPNFLTFG